MSSKRRTVTGWCEDQSWNRVGRSPSSERYGCWTWGRPSQ